MAATAQHATADLATAAVRVLLVDDDEDDYILTRNLLGSLGAGRFALDWVASYEAAIDAIRDDRHDVYLLDYNLGAHNGIELVREALVGGCRRPLILLTGQGDRNVDLEAM